MTNGDWIRSMTDEELAEAYAKKVIELAHECGVKLSLKDNGVTREEFDKAVDDLELIRPYEPTLVKAAWNVFGKSYRYRQQYNEYKARRRETEL